MAKTKVSPLETFSKGFVKENPVLRLVLGTCPALAVSNTMVSAIGMGIATIMVLVMTNTIISALKKVIPSKVRIPAYIVVISTMVTVVQMLVKAFLPVIYDALGVYLPLITVNCIILGRAESFASKNSVALSILDGLGMGIGFLAALFSISLIREFVGGGTILSGIQSLLPFLSGSSFNGVDVASAVSQYTALEPIKIFILPAGGFMVFGFLMALVNRINHKKGKPSVELGCGSCKACDKEAK
ncbi:MAG TPA: electron transport complex subunit E [Clostridiales bacterium]|nr:electron transport complex subunit E [Clostridiales bacterium]HPU67747.1 electron transport complex subunit E [Clostridiales bacterium]HQA05046.1 electron transport complex subunit E [Clostridiales bacterium]HQD72563.1 electron transport complex subunit E [Clostridiales bacterium]